MAEALAALALQRVFRGDVRLHRNSQTAEFGHSTQFFHFCRRATDTIKCGVMGRDLEASWSQRPGRNCKTPWTQMSRVSITSQKKSSGIYLSRFLTSRRIQRSSGREEWKLTPLLPSRDRSALSVGLKPSAVRGTSINLSPLIWRESPLWHEARIMTKSHACPWALRRRSGSYFTARLREPHY